MKKAFIIGSVSKATDEDMNRLDNLTLKYEGNGYEVHLPHRDTNQRADGYNICKENMEAIIEADLIVIDYDKTSKGSHFDMGVAWALKKNVVIERALIESADKNFARMIMEWEARGPVS